MKDSDILDLLVIIALFGYIPVAFMTSKNEVKLMGFVFSAVAVFAVLNIFPFFTPIIFITVPIAWWIVLKPLVKKFNSPPSGQ